MLNLCRLSHPAMNWTSITAFLALFGIGTVVGAYFQSVFQHCQALKKDIHELKRVRYGATLIQMLALLDPEEGLAKLSERRPDLASLEALRQELRVEGTLYPRRHDPRG